MAMSFFAAWTFAILSGFSYASRPLQVLEITRSEGGTLPDWTDCMAVLIISRASSFLSSRIISNRSVRTLLWRSKESDLLISYPLTRSSSETVGQTILPTYLFFLPCVKSGSRSFSNSSVPPSRE